MKKTTFFKVLALVNFIALLSIFLLYRNGSFDRFFYSNNDNRLTSPNGGTPTKTTKDSTPVKADSLKRQRLSSSKSLVLIDDIKFKADSSKPQRDSSKIKLPEKDKRLMYSSKSGAIIEPKLFMSDSLQKQIDLRQKPKKQQ